MQPHSKDARIVLVGGGSGGHFYPLIAIAETLRTNGFSGRLYYLGPTPYDADALQKESISFVRLPAGKVRRYTSFLNIFDGFRTMYGTIVAIIKLFFIYPDCIMSKGGYTSVPVVLAAAFLRIPILVHESDAVPGRANILATKFARTIFVGYAETASAFSHSNVIHTGIPLRSSLFANPPQSVPLFASIDETRPVLLVLGGSQGAERVNELILQSLDELLPLATIIHQTGNAHFEICRASADELVTNSEYRARYIVAPFFDSASLNTAYHHASIVISRAGSNSIFEIALHGKPAILIPIPEDISHDQRTNAYTYARYGGAVVLEEQNLRDGLLRSEFERIMQNTATYETMAKSAKSFTHENAGSYIEREIIEIIKEHAHLP